jgi:hypothetical protein
VVAGDEGEHGHRLRQSPERGLEQVEPVRHVAGHDRHVGGERAEARRHEVDHLGVVVDVKVAGEGDPQHRIII